jgi:hypothetical protein
MADPSDVFMFSGNPIILLYIHSFNDAKTNKLRECKSVTPRLIVEARICRLLVGPDDEVKCFNLPNP